MKKRIGDSWMPAPEYGRSLKGFTLNLLVNDIGAALLFQTRVLNAEVVYADPDFAVLKGFDAEWMLHADHTYDANLLYALLPTNKRGIGIELRLHGCDPDLAADRARQYGYTVFAEAADKPHGLRETYLVDPDGYMWVPDIPVRDD